jgi:hypothetical protein
MVLFFQRVVDGVATGAVYAALALALVLIYRATGILNFAQGEMAMLSTYVHLVPLGRRTLDLGCGGRLPRGVVRGRGTDSNGSSYVRWRGNRRRPFSSC